MNNEFFILLAEDDDADIFLFKRALQKARIFSPMQIVHDGQATVDYLSGTKPYTDRKLHPKPDLVILDVRMPRKDGFEVLQWVRRHAELKRLPVVILGQSPEQSDIDRAYELGANAYLVKQADTGALGVMLKRLHDFWRLTASMPQQQLEAESNADLLYFLPGPRF